jgi:hypothetical protein
MSGRIAIDQGGNIVVAGGSYGAAAFDQVTFPPSVGGPLLCKYTPDGVLLWAKRVEVQGSTSLFSGRALDLAVDSAGNIITTDSRARKISAWEGKTATCRLRNSASERHQTSSRPATWHPAGPATRRPGFRQEGSSAVPETSMCARPITPPGPGAVTTARPTFSLWTATSNPPARQTGWPPQKLPAAGGTTITNPIRRVEAALTLGKAMSYSGAASVASPTGHPRRVCGSQLCLSPGKHERPSQGTSRSTQRRLKTSRQVLMRTHHLLSQ